MSEIKMQINEIVDNINLIMAILDTPGRMRGTKICGTGGSLEITG